MSKKLTAALLCCMLFLLTACGGTASKEPDTVGGAMKADFESRIAESKEMTAQEMADALVGNEIIQFKGATMEVEPGYLSGFDGEITGFEKGVMFGPAISSIPFVGYIFTVPDGDDVDAFVEMLTNSANPRWNVCTEAEETVVEAKGNMVFFLMCPKSFEE